MRVFFSLFFNTDSKILKFIKKFYSNLLICIYDILIIVTIPFIFLFLYFSGYSLVYAFIPIWIDSCMCVLTDWFCIIKLFGKKINYFAKIVLIIWFILSPALTYIFYTRPFLVLCVLYNGLFIPSVLLIWTNGLVAIQFVPLILYIGVLYGYLLLKPKFDTKNKKKQKEKNRERKQNSEEETEV